MYIQSLQRLPITKLLLLPLLFFAPAALAQDGLVSSAETDQSEYAYGQTIELRYTITNEGDEPFTLTSYNSCVANFTLGSFDSLEASICFEAVVSIDFAPGASWTWVWQIVPQEHAVPEESGEHTITAYFGGSFGEGTHAATTTFNAPLYLGGRVRLVLAEGVELEDVQDVAEALNAEVVHATEPTRSYVWEIEGVTVADAVATYAPDPRFIEFAVSRVISFTFYHTTDDEDGAPLSGPLLTAAHPNPFAASTSFALTVPTSGPTRVEVFDVLGRRVAVLHDGPLAAGPEHRFTFHAAALPSGLYVVRATGEGFTQTRRVTLSR